MRKIYLLLIMVFCVNTMMQSQSLWQTVDASAVLLKTTCALPATNFKVYRLQLDAIKKLLDNAPHESFDSKIKPGLLIEIPLSDGKLYTFEFYQYDCMQTELAKKFPGIKTFMARCIEDKTAWARFDYTQWGFHGMVQQGETCTLIDPYTLGNTEFYAVYDKYKCPRVSEFICGNNDDNDMLQLQLQQQNVSLAKTSGTQLRTYRLALACTGEYAAVFGGTVAGASAAMVTAMNRINGIYESEVDVRMVLINNNNLIVYTNGATDPYTNNNGGTMLTENQNNLTTVIGGANYDIGHVFSTGGGGVAVLNSPCSSTNKAKGVTGLSNPVGDAFYVDYVAHEMGHQFGGPHTFNSATGSCNGNRSASSAYEPGSGITIQAYAGICGSDNLANNSIAYFHVKSFNDLVTFTQTGTGNGCATTTSTGNTPPLITSTGANYTIPVSTPFMLTGAATDANGDTLTYSWEEFDLGPASTWNANNGTSPNFRPFSPVAQPYRIFPKMSDIVNNTTTIGEILPTAARSLKFKLTVRDNRMNGAGITNIDSTVTLSVVNPGGAFTVSYPNTALSFPAGTIINATWNVAATDVAPIGCSNVKISLSTDGGFTYPITLVNSTANDGAEDVIIPNNITATARIKVEAVGNIFFDISNTNFAITAPLPLTINTSNVVNATCYTSANGSISITPAGGVPPYSYIWSDGVTLQNQTAIAQGTYTVTVSATNGVTTTSTYIVTSQPQIIINSTQSTLLCYGAKNGTVTLSPTGGTGPFSYFWNNGKTTATLTNLTAGNYTCTVTDSVGCTKLKNITLTQPAQITLTFTSTNATSPNFNNGTATCIPANGFPTYRYTWNTVPSQTTQTATGLVAATYVVTVKDNKKCARNGSVTIGTARYAKNEIGNNIIEQLMPQPADDNLYITLNSSVDYAFCKISIYSIFGAKVGEYNNIERKNETVVISTLNLNSGMYVLAIEGENISHSMPFVVQH